MGDCVKKKVEMGDKSKGNKISGGRGEVKL